MTLIDHSFTQDEIIKYREEIIYHKKLMYLKQNIYKKPFIVINPLGLNKKDIIEDLLNKYNINIESKSISKNWILLSSLMYIHKFDDLRIIKALKYKKLWQNLSIYDIFEAWFIKEDDYDNVISNKYKIRDFIEKNESIDLISLKINHFHVPDKSQLENDYTALKYILFND